jgi:hypothetical protein
MNVEKFPFDFDALQKGDYINPDYLEKITGHKVDSQEYSFAVMQLVSQIESRLEVVCKTNSGGISILTDEEAVFYVRKQNLAANRKKRKQLRRLQTSIDCSNLSQDGQKRFISELNIVGAEVAAVSTVRKQLAGEKREIIKPNFGKSAIVKIQG